MRFQKILLVSPSFFKGRSRLAFLPAAGLAYIAEALTNSGFSVSVVDMNLQYTYQDLKNKIFSFRPDVIGLSVMTLGYKNVYALANQIKSDYPKVIIITGGAHISTLKEKVLEECLAIDYGFVLEGDISIVEFCKGIAPEKIPGFIYRRDDKIVLNKHEDFIQNLDGIGFPKYEHYELKRYSTRQIGIVTSRGCPYNCIYCPVIAAIGKRFRMRSAHNVVEEIEYWYVKGYREILILDDNFTLIRKRVEEICDLLLTKGFSGLRLQCPNGVRADRVDKQLLKKMKEAGFTMLAFGVEAADNRILQNIKKGENITTVEQAIKDACELGFDVDLFFLIGSPGETMKEVRKSFNLALRYPVRNAKFYNIIPFPATELYEQLIKSNLMVRALDDILNGVSNLENEPCYFTPEMSVAERKQAFNIGQRISRIIRRNYFERRILGPSLIKKLASLIYTTPFIDEIANNYSFVIRLKELLKKCLVKSNNKE